MSTDQRILFVCTGNYYRSRFAEAMFNHLAEERGLPWRAFSRGLMKHLAPGEISEDTRQALIERGIERRHTAPEGVQITEADLQAASVIVALQDAEHRPMFIRWFPEWTEKVVYWDVADQPATEPAVALPAIEEEVRRLTHSLAAGGSEPKEAAASTPHAEPAAE